jgi:ribonuclease-3
MPSGKEATRRGREDFDALEADLHHRFTNRDLLREALTHARAKAKTCNERLEFLGDRVLGLVIAETLVQRHPDEDEGQLAPRLNALVSRETCAEMAEALGIGMHMLMARSEAQNGGRRKPALLANVMEAIIAAVYLDAGADAARDFILRHWGTRLDAQRAAPTDPKTALQEWAQARGWSLPVYEAVKRSGPDHDPRFTIRVTLANGESAEAVAPSKRAAERESARLLFERLESDA